jgi:SAM-dependent methyltransferase
VLRERGGSVIEGLLQCGSPECRREYPVIDGVPLLIAGIRAWLGGSLARVTARDDLSPEIESLLGDCAGPGSDHDNARRELSTYAWDHWGDLDEERSPAAAPAPGSATALLGAMLERAGGALGALPDGPVLDLGCATGRTTFELAAASGRHALGVDLNFPMLRTAQRVLTEGVARYPLRRIGVVYDRREHPAAPPRREHVDFWAADAADLPFADGAAALIVSLNVLDCVQSPRDALAELARVLAPGGVALVTTPYDWSPGATPYEQWLGGHSQRGETEGAGEPVLRALLNSGLDSGLTPGAHPAAVEGLEILAEAEDLPWHLRLHDRSTVEYRVHGLVLRKVREAGAPGR